MAWLFECALLFNLDGFEFLERWQFVESGLISQDIIEEVFQVFSIEGLSQFAENLLALIDDGNHRVSHTNSA